MLIYDITKQQTFEHISRWLEELRNHADNNIIVMLVGNKTDLESRRVVETEDAKEYAEKEGLFFLETSALEASNVENAFQKVLEEIYAIVSMKTLIANQEKSTSTSLLGGTKIPVNQESGTTKKGCCI